MNTVPSDRVFEVKNVMLLVQSCEYCPAFVDPKQSRKSGAIGPRLICRMRRLERHFRAVQSFAAA